MFKKQHGISLLESILAAAILGWVLAYAGTQFLIQVKRQEVNKAAAKIVNLQSEIKEMSQSIYLRIADDVTGTESTVVNPLLKATTVGWVPFDSDLAWIKKDNCELSNGVVGSIPSTAVRTFLPCAYNPDVLSLTYISTHFEFVNYNNLNYPQAKRYVKTAWSSYVHTSNNVIDDFIDVITEIKNVTDSEGYKTLIERIYVAEFRKIGTTWESIPNTEISLEELINSNDLTVFENYINRVTNGTNYPGMFINSFYENDISFRRDGSIPMAVDSSICWDNRSGTGRPCIRAYTDPVDGSKDTIVVESELAYGAGKKKTPVQASYQTFVGGRALRVKFLKCATTSTGLNMENKMAAMSSSYSAANEAGTNFTNPSNIVSTGTIGAGGKHAMISGQSLSWTSDAARQEWVIEGAVGFDGRYAINNGGQSVLNNPMSMSFIVLQWCEEK